MTSSGDDPMSVAYDAVSLARALRNLGRPHRAIEKYDEALTVFPQFVEALDECVDVLRRVGDWEGIAQRCAVWLRRFPDHATHGDADRIHSQRIDALIESGGIDHAFAAYGLLAESRTDGQVLDDELLAVMGVRNEMARLPQFFQHHRRIGIGRFLVVDNGSTDGSYEYLCDQDDVVLWSTQGSYRAANCGAVWWDLLLRRYARSNWCVVADADEHFIYPSWESRGLADLCMELDEAGSTCYPTVFLDMYGDRSLSESGIEPNRPLLDQFPYFDSNWFRTRLAFNGPRRNLMNHWGGVRARIFGDRALDAYLLDKVPLFRYRNGQTMMSGNHWIDRPSDEIAHGRGVLLHFKFDSRLADHVREEARRKEHAGGARAHQEIANRMGGTDGIVIFDPDHSIRYETSLRLVELGIMRSNARIGTQLQADELASIPPRSLRFEEPEEVAWSIVTVVGGEHLASRFDSAVRSLDGQPQSEIVLVETGDRSRDPLMDLDAGPHRTRVISTPFHLTEIEALNFGISHSRGTWIHLIPETCVVAPGAHERAAEIVAVDEVEIIVEGDRVRRTHELPFDIGMGSVLISRSVLERLGGFLPLLGRCAAWESIQRFAGDRSGRIEYRPEGSLSIPVADTVSLSAAARRDVSVEIAAIDRAVKSGVLDDNAVRELFERCALIGESRVIRAIEDGSNADALRTLVDVLGLPISDSIRRSLIESLAPRFR